MANVYGNTGVVDAEALEGFEPRVFDIERARIREPQGFERQSRADTVMSLGLRQQRGSAYSNWSLCGAELYTGFAKEMEAELPEGTGDVPDMIDQSVIGYVNDRKGSLGFGGVQA